MAARYLLRVAIALVAVIVGVHKRDAVYHGGHDRGTQQSQAQVSASALPSRPTCNPIAVDPAAHRYGERVVGALTSFSQLARVRITSSWSTTRLMNHYLAEARASDRLVRAIDTDPPPSFPLTAMFAHLRNASLLEGKAFRHMRAATAAGRRAQLTAAGDVAMAEYVELTSVQTQLRRLRDAPPCA